MNRPTSLLVRLLFGITFLAPTLGCNTGEEQSDPPADFGAPKLDIPLCQGAKLSKASVDAGDIVKVTGIEPPDEFALRLHTKAVDKPLQLPAVYNTENKEIQFVAPARVETMDSTTGYVATLHGGGVDCEVGTLKIGPLPEVGDYTLETAVTDMQSDIDNGLARFGLTRQQLIELPPEKQRMVAPLAIAQYLVDHPDNPNSLKKIF